ncbi:hemin ABC transporter substrate-binding protein [Brenneria goodwinii]|uniref:Periplasmic hemin-binding protein n=1 Tax=Brenneria goodwinii TaxID=1109412 RepID=A0A0G4JZF0_9GAMM|nr:hemin ABC transporter substrate-binding protein [Brenneria goodwinii]MCG8154720.1 hemin ABC transporter substrate-binding protein [Brenneria goodwinii]MCG8159943.1 hemin ABC transporter substrate-binding protein [Brenneria goodwinii]MCG8163958.1 hemin ABC transporter substrate-binding protein [Brenneria goodwinii]MCG8168567.1 hemin ABC transporter substrate-binding protein [Brenneria goodwinii]MCG8173878.1 hemin ABC transporter substrate-binding protein [Brenneria goodwinii]
MKNWLFPLLMALPLGASAAERIVSIGGDVTEIIYALGAEKDLVARDSTSLHPDAATKLPDVGYMRQLNTEGILAMRPSLVIASELSQPSLVLQQVADSGAKVINIPAKPVPETVPQKISVIAQALDKEAEGKKLAETYQQQLASVAGTPLPVKALFILSHGGMTAMAAGKNTPADTIIRNVGLTNAMQAIERYQPLSQEGVVASAPDLILISTQGLKSLGGEEQIWKLPGLALTPAGKNHRLLIVDDMAMLGFTLETPALMATIRQAAEQIK